MTAPISLKVDGLGLWHTLVNLTSMLCSDPLDSISASSDSEENFCLRGERQGRKTQLEQLAIGPARIPLGDKEDPVGGLDVVVLVDKVAPVVNLQEHVFYQ